MRDERKAFTRSYSSLIPHPSSLLYRFAVIERFLALFQGDVGFLPRGLAALVAPAALDLSHVVDRADGVHLDLEDGLDRGLDLRLGRVAVDAECQKLPRVLRLFFRRQGLLRDHRRLDD